MERASSLPSPGRFLGHVSAISWLLRSLFALPILVIAVAGVIQFGFLVVAGDTLRSAARAAVDEAVMPQASCQSIAAAARRRLVAAGLDDRIDPVRVEINGRLSSGPAQPESGDRVAVVLALPPSAAAPDFLGPLGIALAGRALRLRLAVRVP